PSGKPGHGVPDECDIAHGTSRDCNGNGIPDECEFSDCNRNCIDDALELNSSTDCNGDGVLDECQAPTPKTWTSDTDFNTGTAPERPVLINVNVSGNGQTAFLQRNTLANTTPLPYLWVTQTKLPSPNVVKVSTFTSQTQSP